MQTIGFLSVYNQEFKPIPNQKFHSDTTVGVIII